MIEKYNQEEVKGHNFISDPYFEEWGNGDWEKGEPNKYTKKKEGNRTYLYISGKGSVSQSVILPKKVRGSQPFLLFIHYRLITLLKIKHRCH